MHLITVLLLVSLRSFCLLTGVSQNNTPYLVVIATHSLQCFWCNLSALEMRNQILDYLHLD